MPFLESLLCFSIVFWFVERFQGEAEGKLVLSVVQEWFCVLECRSVLHTTFLEALGQHFAKKGLSVFFCMASMSQPYRLFRSCS